MSIRKNIYNVMIVISVQPGCMSEWRDGNGEWRGQSITSDITHEVFIDSLIR